MVGCNLYGLGVPPMSNMVGNINERSRQCRLLSGLIVTRYILGCSPKGVVVNQRTLRLPPANKVTLLLCQRLGQQVDGMFAAKCCAHLNLPFAGLAIGDHQIGC